LDEFKAFFLRISVAENNSSFNEIEAVIMQEAFAY